MAINRDRRWRSALCAYASVLLPFNVIAGASRTPGHIPFMLMPCRIKLPPSPRTQCSLHTFHNRRSRRFIPSPPTSFVEASEERLSAA